MQSLDDAKSGREQFKSLYLQGENPNRVDESGSRKHEGVLENIEIRRKH